MLSALITCGTFSMRSIWGRFSVSFRSLSTSHSNPERVPDPFFIPRIFPASDKSWQGLMENNVDLILITIYTGLRPTELLEITTDNVHLDEQYMIGGMKTEAGTDRVIPIADKILPLVKNRYDANRRFLVNNKYGNHYTYGSYVSANFNTVMNKLNMKHLPHDGRHTFASLMDDAGANEVCIKLIMGHSMKNNVTKGVYTHKTTQQLIDEVNKI